MSTPVIIEAALNGITSRGRNSNVPVTPAELAEDAIACVDAGATIVHTHAHDFGAPVDELVATYARVLRAGARRPARHRALPDHRWWHHERGALPPRRRARQQRADPGVVPGSGFGEPRRRRARRAPTADGLRVHEHLQRHALRRRRVRAAPARAERRDLRARVPPGRARLPRGGRAARRHPREALLRGWRLRDGGPCAVGSAAHPRGARPVPRDARRLRDPLGDRAHRRRRAVTSTHARRARARRSPPGRAGGRPAGVRQPRPRPGCEPSLCESVGRPVATLADTERILNLPT